MKEVLWSLAEAIACKKPAPSFDQLNPIITRCGKPSSNPSQQQRSSVIALLGFITCSKGSFHEELVPLIQENVDLLSDKDLIDDSYIQYVALLLSNVVKACQAMTDQSKKEKIPAMAASAEKLALSCARYMQKLVEVTANRNGDENYNVEKLLAAVLSSCSSENGYLPVPRVASAEVMKVIQSCAEFEWQGLSTKEEDKDLLSNPEKDQQKDKENDKENDHVNVNSVVYPHNIRKAAFQFMASLTSVPWVKNDPDVTTAFFNLAQRHRDDVPTPAVWCASCCAQANASLTRQVVVFLTSELLDPIPAYGDDVSENRHFYSVLIRGLANLADTRAQKTPAILEGLQKFILDTIPVQGMDPEVAELALTSFCSLLEIEMISRGFDSIKVLINSLANSLYTLYAELQRVTTQSQQSLNTRRQVERQLTMNLKLLGRIARSLQDKSVTELVVPNLINRVSVPPLPIDEIFLIELTQIAINGHSKSYSLVADFLVNLYRSILSSSAIQQDSAKYIHLVADCFLRIAKGTSSNKVRKDLLGRTLRLFVQLGHQIQRLVDKDPTHQSSSIVGSLGFLLPPLADLFECNFKEDHSERISKDPAMLKLLRATWFYCLVYRFVDEKAWLSEWFSAVLRIAAVMPPVVSFQVTTYLAIEVEFNEFLSTGFREKELNSLRKQVDRVLQGVMIDTKAMTNGQLAYILAVYYLENLRSRSLQFHQTFSYLRDPALQKMMYYPAMKSVSDQVFSSYLSGHVNAKSSSKKENVLDRGMQFLLVNFVSTEEPVRKAADEYILQMLNKFPQLLWSSSCITTLMDLLGLAGQSISSAALDVFATGKVLVRNTPYYVIWPESMSEKLERLKEIKTLTEHWLRSALEHADTETSAILEKYFSEIQESSSLTGKTLDEHLGYSLALKVASEMKDRVSLTLPKGYRDAAVTNKLPWKAGNLNLINSLALKNQYLGEVRAVLELASLTCATKEEAKKSVVKSLSKKIQDHELAFLSRNELNMAKFQSDIYRATAYLMKETEEERITDKELQLLHLVCSAPMFIYTTKSLQCGTFAWTWLLAARPNFDFYVMNELRSVWERSIEHRVGLFSSVERPTSPLSIPKIEVHGADPKLHMYDPLPHRIMLEFLYDRFVVENGRSQAVVNILYGMLLKAIADPSLLSCLPVALGSYFRLLLLCQQLNQGGFAPDQDSEVLMRKRVYAAAFYWFFHPPSWYDPPDGPQVLAEDMGVLHEFCETLQADRMMKKRPVFKQPIPPTASSLLGGTDSFFGFQFTNPSGGAGVTSLLGEKLDQTKRLARSLSISTMTMDNTAQDSKKDLALAEAFPESVSVAVSKETQQQASLLLLLVGHDIDRNAAWHNPQSHVKLKFPGEDSYTTDKPIYKSQWNKYLRTAWKVNPRLAIMMGVRFPYPKVRVVLENVVRENAKAAMVEPESIQFLVTPQNVAADIPQLRYLLYWGEVSPPTALSLLQKEYKSHPYVTQYAIRVLRTFPSDTIIFYLPQLIQCLRYDSSGLVEEYLVDAATRSQLLAHQLIWSCNTYVDEIPKVQNQPIADTVKRLKDRIIQQMVGWAEELYRQEFDFFTRVNNVSGLLLELQTKDERRSRLKEELRKIPIEGKLYLPTNPDTTVHAINYDKASPMQSHAKVPILVVFKVSGSPAIQEEQDKIIYKSVEGNITARTLLGECSSVLTLNNEVVKEREKKHRKSTAPAKKSVRTSSGKERRGTIAEINPTERAEELASDSFRSVKRSASITEVDVKHSEVAEPSTEERKKKQTRQSDGATAENPLKVSASPLDRVGTQERVAHRQRSGSFKRSRSDENILVTVKENTKQSANANSGSALVERRNSENEQGYRWQACIFKVGDDVRQDMLALQIIDLFKRIFESVDLPLFLFPYRVVATSSDCGIIEVVPNAKSRDQLGKQVEGSLYDYFLDRYGHVHTIEYRNARNNFLRSMAAYSVVSYILQIKDRHNGNMLIDDYGHIVHIDFGFIFDISPGGNFKFERAPFKLSQEMLDLMGGSPEAEPFKWFMQYCTKAYLAARDHMQSILTLVALMMDTCMPCFTNDTIANLRFRFCADKSEREAARFMTVVIGDACSAFSNFTTYFYDVFQNFQNGIEMR